MNTNWSQFSFMYNILVHYVYLFKRYIFINKHDYINNINKYIGTQLYANYYDYLFEVI